MKRWTLVACILGSGIVLLDGTVVNVALPRIQIALGGGLAAQQWVVNGYLLTLERADPDRRLARGPVWRAARVRDRGGAASASPRWRARWRRRSARWWSRAPLQGVAGALLVPSSLAVIVNTFPESERGGAIGSWTAWGAIAGVLGPLVAGELLAIGSLAADLPDQHPAGGGVRGADPGGRAQGAAPRESGGRRVDVPGALLCAAGLGGSVFALIEQPRLGWASPAVFVPLIGGIVLLGVLPRV